jgi:hypothetical protein
LVEIEIGKNDETVKDTVNSKTVGFTVFYYCRLAYYMIPDNALKELPLLGFRRKSGVRFSKKLKIV